MKNEMINHDDIEHGLANDFGKENKFTCVKVDSITIMIEFLDCLEYLDLVIKYKEMFNIGFDNMLVWFYNEHLKFVNEKEILVIDGFEPPMQQTQPYTPALILINLSEPPLNPYLIHHSTLQGVMVEAKLEVVVVADLVIIHPPLDMDNMFPTKVAIFNPIASH
ncbi:hypothetical protein E3N88_09618 [Mikania micrantha]|uniref:Uncharacterized protein n=1 Tax=Mikania micrantha TaxID=192012 RepID=A0A5N6PK93_9ASTR|nr:hypothetical protein E3N88_09618 [Mikania micrantha]